MQHFREGQTDFRSAGKDCTEQGLPKNFVITTKRALESFMKVRILHVLELSTAHSSRQLTTTLLKTLAMIDKGLSSDSYDTQPRIVHAFTWSYPQGEESAYERGGDARRLAYGCKFRILVSLRVFWAKRHDI